MSTPHNPYDNAGPAIAGVAKDFEPTRETFVNCGAMWLVKSADLFGKRGVVTLERRNAIRDKLPSNQS